MKRSMRIFRNNVVVGLFLVAPLGITAYIIYLIVRMVSRNWVTKSVTDVVFGVLPQFVKDGMGRFMISQIIAIVLLVLVLFLIGFFVRSFFGRRLYRLAEQLLIRIPVFNKIYIQVRHISETIFSQRETMFQQVVLVEYPRRGLHSMAFVTSSVPTSFDGNFAAENGGTPQERVALFVPTTPNPTSGMMIFVPKADVRPLKISVADAMKLIISAGTVYPGEGEVDDRPTLLDRLEQWITRETPLESPTSHANPD